jgi:HEPN domain-containing protein
MPESYDTVSFHAQLAAEKALKALLVRHQVAFRKGHNLAELLELVESVESGTREALQGGRRGNGPGSTPGRGI